MRADWFDRLQQALAAHVLPDCSFPDLLPAAVLVPLLDAPEGIGVLLTVRSSDLAHHPGQIAFPGGRLDPGETTLQTALRETEEEVGLDVSPHAILGRLSCRPSPAGYCAEPFVARLPWPQPLTLLASEVAETFIVPLNELLALNPTEQVVTSQGREIRLHAYPWQGRNIWGLTGNVLHELLEIIRANVGSVP
jgi:8-oxo-dGTP pyrophosphatase MutT (NUDIX family)